MAEQAAAAAFLHDELQRVIRVSVILHLFTAHLFAADCVANKKS